jgi:hypothetical protein
MLCNRGHFRLSFDGLHQDLLRGLRYVEPVDDNLYTYSHEIWSLYMRTCVELEALFKGVAAVLGRAAVLQKDRPTILDYRLLEADLGLERRQIGMHFWRPQPKYIEPFASWSTNKPPVAWYSTYNKVKHNREEHFHLANFGNLTSAFCGLFQVVIQTNILPTSRECDHLVTTTSTGLNEAVFPRYQLSQRDHRVQE